MANENIEKTTMITKGRFYERAIIPFGLKKLHQYIISYHE
jgi:hypothetical protein